MTESKLNSSEKAQESVHTDHEAPTFRIVHLFLCMVALAIFFTIEETTIRIAEKIGEGSFDIFSHTAFGWVRSVLQYAIALGLAGCWVFTRFELGRKFKWQPGHILITVSLSMFLFLVFYRLERAYSFANPNLEHWGFLYGNIVFLIGIATLASVGIFVFWRQLWWRIYFILYTGSWIMLTVHFVVWMWMPNLTRSLAPQTDFHVFDILQLGIHGVTFALFLFAIFIDRKRSAKRDWIHYVSCIHAAFFLHIIVLYRDVDGFFRP